MNSRRAANILPTFQPPQRATHTLKSFDGSFKTHQGRTREHATHTRKVCPTPLLHLAMDSYAESLPDVPRSQYSESACEPTKVKTATHATSATKQKATPHHQHTNRHGVSECRRSDVRSKELEDNITDMQDTDIISALDVCANAKATWGKRWRSPVSNLLGKENQPFSQTGRTQ